MRAKLPLLRSEGRKSALREPKSAQKPHFCAREVGKVLFGKAKARKTATSALGRPKNGYWEDLPRTKSLFLSLKSPKTWKKLTKKGQNGHFCPQKPLKWLFGRQKKDKNSSFVLEQAQKLAKIDSKRTKSPLLSSGRRKMAVGKPEKPLPAIHLPHF